ncbi:UMTA methyltransferase family protein [Aspergillus sclerotioniger CBS 115572]|uniref:UMTA methyltransferase family protein n=1 Tax=Aspergillus sclerotioniger CBS 115572 TaxID=1450535 RepID=A0A317XDS1_9EURO|nr:UMTA methyltransferase family protein [Aspergillus sclerotioniger CBS 115572]PWY96694.1 UMTA methyltransferase family protein [Aspergillus sclerotioniger CBS 115572]
MGDNTTPTPPTETGTGTATFHLASSESYALQHNHLAACRLNLQHYLWREVFRFNIHPSIPTTTTPLAIADIACGTSLWLIDTARDLPHAHLDGYDIDLTQSPPPQWLPKNISLHEWDALTPAPAHLHGKYDIIHVRLVVLFLTGIDPTVFIRNIYTMLKPGGWVQWDELDCANISVKTTTPGVSVPALEELKVACSADGRHDWSIELAEILANHGFEDTKLQFFDEKDELVRAFGDQHLLTMGEFANKLAGRGEKLAAGRFNLLVERAYGEMVERGAALAIPRVVALGRRPLSSSSSS